MGDAKDKICDICGTIGYPELIVTCCKCKKASEHIYCTISLLYPFPEKWYCKECFGKDEVVHDENMQLKDKIVSDRSNFEKTNTPAGKNVLLDERATSEQLCIDGGCPKAFGCQEISHQVLGEADKAAFAGSSSSKHVMQPSFPRRSLVKANVPSDEKASPDQINVDQKQLTGNSEPLVSRDISLQVLDVGAELAGSHSSKPTMQLSSYDSSVKKTNIPGERSVPLDERKSSEQIHVDRKEPIGSPKPIGSQNWPFHVLDVGKGETYPAAGSSSSKHVMQPSFRDSSLKRVETGKVKFLSTEEVPFLISGIQVSRKWGSLGPGPHRIDQENIKSHPILSRKPICMPTLANSKESKVLHQPNKGFDYTDEMLTTATETRRNKTSDMAGSESNGRQSQRVADAARRQRDDVASSTPTSDTAAVTLYESGGSTSAASPPPKKRRKYKGLNAMEAPTGDHKIEVQFDHKGKKAIGDNASLLTYELGLIARTSIPLELKTWTAVKTPVRDHLMDRVDKKFTTSDIPQAVFRAYCLEEIKQRYKHHRRNLNAHFKSFQTTALARENSYKNVAPQHKSLKNTENRAKLLYNHFAGTKSFVAHRADYEAEVITDGGVTQGIDEIELFQRTHENQQGWIVHAAQQRHTQMVELRDQQQTSTERSSGTIPMSEVEICSQVIGKRFMSGLGKRRSGSSTSDRSQDFHTL